MVTDEKQIEFEYNYGEFIIDHPSVSYRHWVWKNGCWFPSKCQDVSFLVLQSAGFLISCPDNSDSRILFGGPAELRGPGQTEYHPFEFLEVVPYDPDTWINFLANYRCVLEHFKEVYSTNKYHRQVLYLDQEI